jgi:hypothetical protein
MIVFWDFDIFFIILEFLFDFLKLCDMLYESREVYLKKTFHLLENEIFLKQFNQLMFNNYNKER